MDSNTQIKSNLDSFIKYESENVFIPTPNFPIVNLDNNKEILNSNNVTKNSSFDTIDIPFADDDEEHEDENDVKLPLFPLIDDIKIDHRIIDPSHIELDEPDTMLNNRMLTPLPPQQPEIDINAYQHKKTLAQGMMDLALLLANANQLRYVLESKSIHTYYLVNIVLLAISITLQITVGIALIINSQYGVKNEREMRFANRINNFTLIGIFLITIVNVFISAFGVADNTSSV